MKSKRITSVFIASLLLTSSIPSTFMASNVIMAQASSNKIVISQQPSSVVVPVDSNVSFSVAADGDGLSYQWQYRSGIKWGNLSWNGANSDTLDFKANASRMAYEYRCVISDSTGNSVSSDIVTVTAPIDTDVEIIDQPVSKKAKIGDIVSFNINAINVVSYQWQYRDANNGWTNLGWNSSDTNTLSFTANQYRMTFDYRCVLKDSIGQTIYSKIVNVSELIDEPICIINEPTSQAVPVNSTVSLHIDATGVDSYQWQYSYGNGSWGNLSWEGANTDTLSFKATAYRMTLLYRCVLRDKDGNEKNSQVVHVEEDKTQPTIVIVSQPESIQAPLNSLVNFHIEATGVETYQWQYSYGNDSWSNLSWEGANTATLSFKATEYRTHLAYRCVLTDKDGNTVNSISVNVEEAKNDTTINIKSQPESMSVVLNSTVNLHIDATGVDSYQWQYSYGNGSWGNLSWEGANTDTLSFKANAYRMTLLYRCVLRDKDGNEVISESVTITEKLLSPITITNPESITIASDSSATFTLEATGTGDLTYLWESSTDGENWTTCGENSNTLTVDGKTAVSGTQYRCTVSDNYGQKVTSNTATLTIKKPLEISSQPVSITATENNRVTFSIEATGENVSYQWQKATSDTEELLWTDIEGATYGTYTFTAALADNGNRYRCIVSDGEDTINSSVATLTVKPENAVITNGTKEITINKGEAYQLDLVGKGLRYIANASNVTVDKYGVVNAKETGTGYVFVIDSYGHKCFYKIHVVEKYEELAFDEIEYNVIPGKIFRLYTNKDASYVISDDDRALVYDDYYDNYCNVTCFLPGVYTAIAYTENGEFTFTTINVSGEVTDIESKTSYEGENDTYNTNWYKYVNESDVCEMLTFDIADSDEISYDNLFYTLYYSGCYTHPCMYWGSSIEYEEIYVQPGEEIYVRPFEGNDEHSAYNFTMTATPYISIEYALEEQKDVVLDRYDYTEYTFTPDSSGEYELTAFSINEFNWIITDSENNVVKNESSYGAVYKTFNLKENENYTIRFTPNSMKGTSSLTFEITKATDDIIVADVNTVYDTGIIRSGQTVYYKFEIGKNSDNPALDIFEFSREYSDYLSYTVLGADMYTPYELHWGDESAKLYIEEPTVIYVKVVNNGSSAQVTNFEIKQYEKTITQLSEEAENTAEISAYEADWYEFTAPENGNYCISFGFDSYTDNFMPLNFEIYTGDDLVYDEDLSAYYMYDGYGFNHTMVKGEKLYVKVTGNCSENNENGAMSYNWSITSNQTYLLEELTLDTLTEVSTVNGKQTVFKFTAPVYGTYYFWSESKRDTYGILSSMPNGDYIVDDDDNSGYDHNFCITYRLTAGETVYLQTGQVSGRKIEYNIMVSKTNNSQNYRPVFEFVEMKVNTPVEGSYYSIKSFDRFKFTAETAGTYVFTSENAVNRFGDLANMYGELYSDDALTNQLAYDDDGSESYKQFRIEYELEEGQTVYLKPRNYYSTMECEYAVTVTKTEEMNETEILGTVDSFGDISTSSSFNTDSSSAIIQVNCMNSIPMDFYMLTNSEINMWTSLSLESDDNRENEQTGIEFSFNYAPMADCYYIFIETTDGSSIGDIEVGYTYNELEPGYEDVCSECGGLNSEHTPDCSMGFVEDGSED